MPDTYAINKKYKLTLENNDAIPLIKLFLLAVDQSTSTDPPSVKNNHPKKERGGAHIHTYLQNSESKTEQW